MENIEIENKTVEIETGHGMWKEGNMEIEVCCDALATTVLTYVIINKTLKRWCAYIAGVPGKNHDKELEELIRIGKSTRLRYDVAKLIYPEFTEYTWVD